MPQRLILALAALCFALLPACGGGGGAVLVSGPTGPAGPVPFDGPVYQAYTAFGGLADAAVDVYTYETLGDGPRHVVPTAADGSFGIPRYLVTPDTLIVVRVRGGMGSPDGGAPRESLGAFHAVFTPEQVEAETAVVGFGTEVLYLRLRHALATNLPRADVLALMNQRARCLLADDLDGDLDRDADDVAADDAGAVEAMYPSSRDDIVQAIFDGGPIPYPSVLPLTEPKQPRWLLTDTTLAPNTSISRSLGVGDLAYVGTDTGVWIYRYDPSESPALAHLDTVPTAGPVRDVAVHGGVLYVLGYRHLETFDVTDPSDVRARDALELTTDPRGEQLALAGDVAYLAMGDEGIRMVDVSDPDHLVEVGAPVAGTFRSVSTLGGNLFATGDTGSTQSYAYDLSNPTAPVWIGGGSHTGSARAVVATTPKEAAVVELGRWAHLEALDGGFAFHQLGYDVAMTSPTWPADTRLYGDILVTSFWDGTVEFLDVHDRRNGKRIPGITSPAIDGMGTIGRVDTSAVTTHGLLVFQFGQVSVWSWDPLDTPDPILSRTFVGNGSAAKGVALDGDRCYLATYKGIQIHDLADPSAPQPRGANEGGIANSLFLVGTTLYTGADNGPMRIYDVADPDHPTLENTVSGSFRGFDARDGRLYTGRDGDFAVLDIGDPFLPVELGTWPMTVASAVAVVGDQAYVTDRYESGYTRVIDVTDPTALAETTAVGPRPLGGRPGLLARLPDERLLVGGFNLNNLVGARLEVLDVADPANPTVTGSVLTPGYRHNALAVRNGFAYVASDGPVLVIDVRDPRQPHWVDTVPTPRSWGVDVNARCGAAGADDWGLVVFRTAVRDVP